MSEIIPKLIEEEKKRFEEVTLEDIKKIYQQWKKREGEENIKVEGNRLCVAGINIGEITYKRLKITLKFIEDVIIPQLQQ
ncbi:MAG: hypothetical protein J7L51_03020 [Desulfurococcales archaeon]|nr:hypothetical protein [Desulfurococcales archaeon]